MTARAIYGGRKIDDDDRETILKVVDNYLTSAQLQTTSKKLKQKA